MPDLARIRYVTEHYFDLQGLRLFVWGLVCLAVAAEDANWIPTWVLLALLMPIGVALIWLSIPWYQRTFGQVDAPPAALGRANLIGLPVFIVAVTIDKLWHPVVFLAPFAFALWLLLMYVQGGRRFRWYYGVVAALIVSLNLARSALALPPGHALARSGVVIWSLMGLGLVLVGLLDHWLLVRTFKPVAGADEHV